MDCVKTPGLFERWLDIERSTGRPMTEVLADLNAAAGTRYKHNWPSVVASRGFELERCPLAVRRYMMGKVLVREMQDIGVPLDQAQLEKLVISLT